MNTSTIRAWAAFHLMKLAVWIDHRMVMKMSITLASAEARARMHDAGIEGVRHYDDGTFEVVRTDTNQTRH